MQYSVLNVAKRVSNFAVTFEPDPADTSCSTALRVSTDGPYRQRKTKILNYSVHCCHQNLVRPNQTLVDQLTMKKATW